MNALVTAGRDVLGAGDWQSGDDAFRAALDIAETGEPLHRAEAAVRWIDELEAVAARRGIRELLLRATVYRARLGEPGALDAAESLAGQIDNPALDRLLGFVELSAGAS